MLDWSLNRALRRALRRPRARLSVSLAVRRRRPHRARRSFEGSPPGLCSKRPRESVRVPLLARASASGGTESTTTLQPCFAVVSRPAPSAGATATAASRRAHSRSAFGAAAALLPRPPLQPPPRQPAPPPLALPARTEPAAPLSQQPRQCRTSSLSRRPTRRLSCAPFSGRSGGGSPEASCCSRRAAASLWSSRESWAR